MPLGSVNLDSTPEEERNADIQNIKKVLDVLHKHTLFLWINLYQENFITAAVILRLVCEFLC